MGYEDFTTYIEVDPGSSITKTTTKVNWVALDQDTDSYVYKDFTAGYFGNFEHNIEVYLNSATTGYGMAAHWVLANLIDDWNYLHATYQQCLGFYTTNYEGAAIFRMRDGPSGVSDQYQGSFDTLYWCTVKRADATFIVKIYSDSGRTNLLDTLSVACTITTLRYLYALDCHNNGSSTRKHTGFSQNFDLGPITETFSDSVNISDSVLFKHKLSFSDSINLIDSLLIKRLLNLTDNINVSDSVIYKHLINLTDSINISDDAVYKHIVALADSIGISDSLLLKYMISLFDTIGIEDSPLFKHLINLVDTISITDLMAIEGAIYIFDNISILDDIDIAIKDTCGTIFQLQGDTYTVFLPIPEYAGELGSLNNELVLFDFWSNERSTDTIGIDSEPIILGGVIFTCTDDKEVEMTAITAKFLNIHEMMDNHEEIRITGLNNCVDAIYVIKNFNYKTIRRSPYAYTWQLTLEYVRAL